ncbi:hypothetical protein ACFQZZ_12615 [Nocardia sp. GCM10030253]|uniref:hypothetical protein n=1 Tax=Nocardia sp. GCM10030253 TaxID=3273404 RepID=UPI0036437163
MASMWPDAVDDIFASDQAVAFGYVTPARGVVLTPMTNFGLRDRAAGTMTPLNSSIAMFAKLTRLQQNPQVAIAYHTRAHSHTDRQEYVLVQGEASLSPLHDRNWLVAHQDAWERFAGPRNVGPLWEKWLRPYHWRIGINIAVERITVWPDLQCAGPYGIYGNALPGGQPAPQRLPAKGTGPRVNHERAARFVADRPNRLLSWVDREGFPVIVPVGVRDTDEHGIILTNPTGWAPYGGRRAGLLAHSFARYTYGQNLRKYTGWLDNNGNRLVYAPHTASGYHIPSSRTAYRLAAGYGTWRGYLRARRAGFPPVPEAASER